MRVDFFNLSLGLGFVGVREVLGLGHGSGSGYEGGIEGNTNGKQTPIWEAEWDAAWKWEGRGREQRFVEDGKEELERKWGSDFPFSGISTFAHLPHTKCLLSPGSESGNGLFDIAVLGVPFDTATSYRPGARFGPRAIREASARQAPYRAFNHRAGMNPFLSWATIIDCGDIPISPFDNGVALRQMTEAYLTLLSRPSSSSNSKTSEDLAYSIPKIISLGGDHSLALPALRALSKVHGEQISVLHFDAHLDTWDPSKYPSSWPSKQAQFTHGSMFWLAHREGLLRENGSIHAGLRTRLTNLGDYEDDDEQGFLRIMADDIDDIGTAGVISKIKDRIGDRKVYLTVDIDVLDPGIAPGTGTPEPGGWTSRELIRILRGLEGLNVVGADVVEVSPTYDTAGAQTALMGAQVVFEILTSIVKRGIEDGMGKGGKVEL